MSNKSEISQISTLNSKKEMHSMSREKKILILFCDKSFLEETTATFPPSLPFSTLTNTL